MTSKEKDTTFNWKFLTRNFPYSAMGGLLFGYDWVVIGGAKPFYEPFFEIYRKSFYAGMGNELCTGWLPGGAGLSGWFSDRFGRKKLLILSACLFVVASLGTGSANHLTAFIFFRITGGIGIGLASNLSPVYIAEITPANLRGRFVSINQLTIVIGILAAQLINWRIAEPVPSGATPADIMTSWNGQTGWRWMFYACAVPAVLFFILMWFVPESPRWLARERRNHAKNSQDTFADMEVKFMPIVNLLQ